MERPAPQPVGLLNLGEILRALSNRISKKLGQAEFSRMASGHPSLIWYGMTFPQKKHSFLRKCHSARVSQVLHTHQQNGSSWAPTTKPATKRQLGLFSVRIFQVLDTKARATLNSAQFPRKSRESFAVWACDFFRTQMVLKLDFKVSGFGKKWRCDFFFPLSGHALPVKGCESSACLYLGKACIALSPFLRSTSVKGLSAGCSVGRSVGPLRHLISGGIEVLWSTAWPVLALVSFAGHLSWHQVKTLC